MDALCIHKPVFEGKAMAIKGNDSQLLPGDKGVVNGEPEAVRPGGSAAAPTDPPKLPERKKTPEGWRPGVGPKFPAGI